MQINRALYILLLFLGLAAAAKSSSKKGTSAKSSIKSNVKSAAASATKASVISTKASTLEKKASSTGTAKAASITGSVSKKSPTGTASARPSSSVYPIPKPIIEKPPVEPKTQPKGLESVSGGFWEGETLNARDDFNSTEEFDLPVATVFKRETRAEKRLRKCLDDAKLSKSMEGDDNWPLLSASYNRRTQFTPSAVVMPKSAENVGKAIVCATKNGMRVQAKGGGHSYAGFSNGGKDGLVIIDLQRFSSVTMDGNNVVAGGGVRLGNLAGELLKSNRALPHGDCPPVGLAGHSLHGGFGYASRMWGLSTDAIRELEVVLENGQVMVTNARRNKELYWGLRGGADFLGVVTKITLKTEPMPRNVIRWRYDMNDIAGNAAKMADYIATIQWLVTKTSWASEKLGLTVRLSSGTFRIAGYYYGTMKEFERNILPRINNAVEGRTVVLQDMTYREALVSIAGGMTLDQPTRGYAGSSNFYANNVLVTERSPLSMKTYEAWLTAILKEGRKFRPRWVITMRLMGGDSSKVKSKLGGESAVDYSGDLWVIQHDANTVRNNDVIPWLKDLVSILKNGGANGHFLPFVDAELSGRAAHRESFGSTTRNRLQDLKDKYDPDDTFWNPHAFMASKKK